MEIPVGWPTDFGARERADDRLEKSMIDAPESDELEYRPGVGIMLLNDRGLLFVARRINMPGDAWQMPQGGIDEGETPSEAAVRELKEEIGTDAAEIVAESRGWLRYDLPEELVGKVWGGRWRGQRQKWFVMRFTGTDADIRLDTAEPEFAAWKWVPVRRIPYLVVSFKRQLYLELLAEFPELSPRSSAGLSEILADPIVRMTMAADSISEDDLYALLRQIAEKIDQGRKS